MGGCLKNILILIVAVLAFIGFKSIGGIDYIKNLIQNFQNPPEKTLQVQAQKLADFSKLPKGYKLTRAVDMFGVKAVIASYTQNNQKLVFADPGWAFNLSKNDIRSKSIDNDLKQIASKFSFQPVKLQNLTIQEKGFFKAMDQSIPYVKLKVDLNSAPAPYKSIEGIIGVANDKNNKDKVIIALNQPGKYNQSIAENFFRTVKLNNK